MFFQGKDLTKRSNDFEIVAFLPQGFFASFSIACFL